MSYQLNLIDEKLLPVAVRPSVAAVLVVAGLCLVAGYGHLSWERGQLARSLAQPGADPAAAVTEAPLDPAFEARRLQLQRDERLRDALAGFRDLPLDSAARLQQLASALPDALWLTDIELSGSRGVRIAGGALDPAALAAYATRLGQVPAFSGLPLQALTVEPMRADEARPEGPEAADGAASGATVGRAMHHHFVLTSGQLAASDESPK